MLVKCNYGGSKKCSNKTNDFVNYFCDLKYPCKKEHLKEQWKSLPLNEDLWCGKNSKFIQLKKVK